MIQSNRPNSSKAAAASARRFRRAVGLRLVLLLFASVWTFPAFGDFTLYAGSASSPEWLQIGTNTVDLFISSDATPTSSGTACVDGDGDELCAWRIELEVEGGLSLVSFSPENMGSTIWNLSATSLLANGGNVTDGSLLPEKIGTLTVEFAEEGRLTIAAASSGVAADLSLEEIQGGVIAVPEPSTQMALTAGFALLAMLAQRRR